MFGALHPAFVFHGRQRHFELRLRRKRFEERVLPHIGLTETDQDILKDSALRIG